MSSPIDHKQAAIEQWTADPCGESVAEGEPGSRAYFERLLDGRHEYAPWMREALDCDVDARPATCSTSAAARASTSTRYAAAGARATGIDLTPRHCELAEPHLGAHGARRDVVNGDAERLPFADATLRPRVEQRRAAPHSGHARARCARSVASCKPGGEARIIVYNRSSLHYWVQQVLYSGVLTRGLLEERSMARPPVARRGALERRGAPAGARVQPATDAAAA